MLSRRRFIATGAAAGALVAVPPSLAQDHAGAPDNPITPGDLAAAERVQGIAHSREARERMLPDVNDRLQRFAAIRDAGLTNDVPPALTFDLSLSPEPRPAPGPGFEFQAPGIQRAAGDDLAYAGVARLSAMISSGAISSVELTRFFLDRLRRLDPQVKAVVTLTEARALQKAEEMDRELSAGINRGPLHGIPYGAKDLLAVRGYPTTDGVAMFADREHDFDAAAIQRLDAAGAVLVAKLSLGELAWGDVWFGGMTRNPWNLDQGASGSSAGPGAAVAAGMVPFAIGSETLGSIVSPSTRNGVTGLRPTFGRVSTRGAMALSWSMDKLGPMTRSALDAAIVMEALRGPDPEARDQTEDPAFPFEMSMHLSGMRVGYLADAFASGEGAGGDADRRTLQHLRDLNADLTPVTLPDDVPAAALLIILEAEAGAAFDGITRSSAVDGMVRQERYAWPNVFRHARHIPAVDYINANRHRTRLMQRMAVVFESIDLLVMPSFGNLGLAIGNLTGHPAVVVPNALLPIDNHPERRNPRSITFVGPLWKDHLPLMAAHALQAVTDWHSRRPPLR
ncbi:amidase [soil metagenome]